MAKYYQLTKEDVDAILVSNTASNVKNKIEKQSKPIKVRTAKAKGMALQAEVAKWICNLIGVEYENTDEGLVCPRPSGLNGCDIILRGKAKTLFPFSVEVKNQENMNLADTVQQAEANQTATMPYIIYHRRKALKNDVVIMDAETFATLLRKDK